MSSLTHLDDDGRARMIDVGGKPVTRRVARAGGRLTTTAEVIGLVRADDLPKADVLATARIAGIAGAKRTPDPTTAGDFCRRFTEQDVRKLMNIFDEMRLKVWARQPASFFEEALSDMDGTLVETAAEKMQGIDIAYNGFAGGTINSIAFCAR